MRRLNAWTLARWALPAAIAGLAVWLLAPVQAVDQAPVRGGDRVDTPRAAAAADDETAAGPDRQHLENLARAMAEGLPYVPGEVLVKYRPGVDAAGRQGALGALRLDRASARTRWIGDLQHVESADIDDAEHASAVMARQPEVLYAHPNYIARVHRVPNDPYYSSQWNFEAINLPLAWDINWGGTNGANAVTVGIVDTGFPQASGTYSQPIWTGSSFQTFPIPFAKAADFDHAKVVAGRDFAMGWNIFFDAMGHGTHTAATVAQQTDNSLGYAGIAHGATIIPAKVCVGYWDMQMYWGTIGRSGYADPDGYGCSLSAMIAGMKWVVDNGARVVNMSIGGISPTPAFLDTLHYAVDHGAFVSLSAGNEAKNGNPTTYPASYAPQIQGVVAVGSVTRSLARASYSSYGSYVELAAPGGGAGDIYQMIPYQGDLDYRLASPRFDRFAGTGYQGTSMAAPHVAGVAALLYSQGVTNPAAIEAALERFAKDLGTAGRDDEFGYGLIDARATLRGLGVAK